MRPADRALIALIALLLVLALLTGPVWRWWDPEPFRAIEARQAWMRGDELDPAGRAWQAGQDDKWRVVRSSAGDEVGRAEDGWLMVRAWAPLTSAEQGREAVWLVLLMLIPGLALGRWLSGRLPRSDIPWRRAGAVVAVACVAGTQTALLGEVRGVGPWLRELPLLPGKRCPTALGMHLSFFAALGALVFAHRELGEIPPRSGD